MGEEEKYFDRYAPLPSVMESKSGKAKMGFKLDGDNLLYLIAAAVAAMALLAFVYYSVLQQNNAYGRQAVAGNAAVNNPVFNYSLTLENGAAIDSALAAGLHLSKQTQDAIAGLDAGEEKTFKLSPSEAFGEYNESLIISINRTQNFIARKMDVARVSLVALDEFKKQFSMQPEANKNYTFQDSPISYTVLSINGTEVEVSKNIEVGKIIPIDEIFFQYVSEITPDKIVILITAENQTKETEIGNLTIENGPEYITTTLTPLVGKRIVIGGVSAEDAKVLSYDSNQIFLDYNGEFAGNVVVLKVKALKK